MNDYYLNFVYYFGVDINSQSKKEQALLVSNGVNDEVMIMF